MELMNDSKFNMWRACIAVIYLDNKVTKEELDWANEKIQKLPLTNEQRTILQFDLKNGVIFNSVLPKITDKVDRAFLVNTFRVLANIDHDFSEIEKNKFKELESKVLGALDLGAITHEVEKMQTEFYNEKEVYKDYNKSSIFEHTFHQFMKILNLGDYKFPKK